MGSSVFAEQPIFPLSHLKEKAPFQLDVTVLKVRQKKSEGKYNIFHKVRVENVIRGEGVAVGDELLVCSKKYINRIGTTGTIGDRGFFSGINGLPVVGDFGRIYAKGTKKLLTTFPPNGWQKLGKVVRVVAVICSSKLESQVKTFSKIVEKDRGIQTFFTGIHPNARISPGPIYSVESFTNVDALVLSIECKPNKNTMELILAGLPLGKSVVMMGETYCVLFGEEEETISVPLELVIQWDGTHDIFSGVSFDNVVHIQTGDCVVTEVSESANVLLWGLNVPTGQKIPLRWVEEKEIDPNVPPQRIVGTQLSAENALQSEAVSLILQNAIKWAGRIQ